MRILVFLSIFLLVSCHSIHNDNSYLRMIGDILQDDNVDEANFKLCNGDKMAIQYYALGEKTYEGEKIAIEILINIYKL
jgi:hypothetical protein